MQDSAREDLVRRHVDAFNAGDVDRLLADFAPDAEWVTGDHVVPTGGLRPFFAAAVQHLRPHLTLVRVIDGTDAVAVEMTETWTVEGEVRSAALIAVLDVEGGRICRGKVYREGSADA
ncbi:hypothetical protein FBY24_1722 [Cellulomonas sp. SLBN-39]|nr:hypothetical protein FBY24_1722 [Cellulomonas sp. SLBN-39]